MTQSKRSRKQQDERNKIVQTRKDVESLANRISQCKKVGFDTEAYGPPLYRKDGKAEMVNVYRCTPAGFSIALPDGSAYYVPVGHYRFNVPILMSRPIFQAMASLDEVWAHNWKFDMRIWAMLTDVPLPRMRDSMIHLFTHGMSAMGRYNLKSLSEKYLKVKAPSFEETTKGQMYGQLDPRDQDVIDYACHDARNTLSLSDVADQHKSFDLEMKFVSVLEHMETSGMGIDCDGLLQLESDIWADLKPVVDQWSFLFDEKINSPSALQSFFGSIWPEDKFLKMTDKSGNFKLDKDNIDYLCAILDKDTIGYKAAKLKQTHASLVKIYGTYTSTLVSAAQSFPDGRLHSNLNHTGAGTGRLSNSDPNLQNIPSARTELGKRVRQCFVPNEGHVLVAADYSQIELRVLAHFAGQGALFDAYKDGRDLHQQTADMIGSNRNIGKTYNFAQTYGAGVKKIASMLEIHPREANKYMNAFRKAYPEINDVKCAAISQCDDLGGVHTILERFREIPEIGGTDKVRWSGERKAMNTLIQGGGADIMKLALIDLYRQKPISWKMISTVHDEVTFEVPKEDERAAIQFVTDVMQKAYQLRVPLVAEASSGATWLDCK